MSKNRWIPSLAAACCLLAVTACTDRAASEADRRQVDAAVDKTGKAAAAAAEKAAELAETARDKTRAFVTSPERKQDAAAIKEAITGAGAAVDDAAITLSVSKALARDNELAAHRIEVDTKAGVVHLTGAASSAAAKARASELAGSVQGVTTVDNALQVRAM